MTSQGHVTTASLKQANKEDNRETFFIRLHLKKFCASILHTVNCRTLKSTMWKFEHGLTNSHGVINKSFGVEESWSYMYINLTWVCKIYIILLNQILVLYSFFCRTKSCHILLSVGCSVWFNFKRQNQIYPLPRRSRVDSQWGHIEASSWSARCQRL